MNVSHFIEISHPMGGATYSDRWIVYRRIIFNNIHQTRTGYLVPVA